MKKFYLLFVAILIAALPLRAELTSPWTVNLYTSAPSSAFKADTDNKITYNGADWVVTPTSADSSAAINCQKNGNEPKGYQFSTAKAKPYLTVTLTTSAFKDYKITKVEVQAKGVSSSTNSDCQITVGDFVSDKTTYSGATATTTTVEPDASGDLTILFTNNSSTVTDATTGIVVCDITVTFTDIDTGDETTVSKPSIKGPSNNFFDDSEVTIETSTEGASIYYLLDSEETPSATNGTLYSGPITIKAGKTTTVSAIAVKEGLDDSEVNTKTFVGGTTFANIAALKAGSPVDGTKYRISSPITVAYVNASKGDILLTDGTDATSGIFVYGTAKNTTLTAGATISNTVGTYSYGTYSVRPQFTLDSYTLGSETADVTPKLYESAEALVETANYNQYVRLEGQTVTDSKIGDITLYDRYGLNQTYDAANTYDIEGIYTLYSSDTNQLIPTSVSLHKVETTEKPKITSVTFGETTVSSDVEISAWPGETIDITASEADAIKITVTADGVDDATTTIEGAAGKFTLPDVAEAKISIVATNSNGDSESVDFTYKEKEPEALVATYNGSVLENGKEYEVSLNGVITLTAKGATSITYTAPEADDAATVTDGKITITVLGEYTIKASNAAGSNEITVTLTEAPNSVYSLVTSTNDITTDAKYIIAASSVGKALGTTINGTTNSYGINAVDATYDAEKSTISVAAAQAAEFTISAVDNGYTFAYGEQYLTPISTTSTNLNFSDTATKLTVSIDASYNATITISSDSESKRGVIYNSSNGFRHYATSNATSNGYANVQLYKYIGKEGDIPGEDVSVSEIAADVTDLSGAEYYGLNGVRVAASRLTPGLYIVRLPNGTARKTIVK